MKKTFKKIITVLLQLEARAVLNKYRPKIVAVTGSVGKTSTKDAIYAVLSVAYFARKSSKSFNSEIGVPLTILGLPNAWNNPLAWLKNLLDGFLLIILPHIYPQWLVIEVGADRPGDIKSIASWLRPDIAVVTRLGEVPVHIEFFDSGEQVRREKSELVQAVGKDGTVILNADDKLVSTLRPMAKGKVMTYGSTTPADVSGTDFRLIYDITPPFFPTGISFQASIGDKKNSVEMSGVLGRQHMYTALAALTVAEAVASAMPITTKTGAKTRRIDFEMAVKALRDHCSAPGRMKLLQGVNNTCIIDDSYNSSPIAANGALDTLKNVNCAGRKIAVLGDMLELGRYSHDEHEKLGVQAAEIADEIYAVGTRARGILSSALAVGFPEARAFGFDDSASAGEALRHNLKEGDIVLVKGSQSVRMEKAVALILAEPKRAGELLARQEEGWKNKA